MKSYLSVGNGACVCWRKNPDGTVRLWDSKTASEDAHWVFTPAQWDEFTSLVRAGILNDRMTWFYAGDGTADLEIATMWLSPDEMAWRRRDTEVVLRFTATEVAAFVRAAAFGQTQFASWQQTGIYTALGSDAPDSDAPDSDAALQSA